MRFLTLPCHESLRLFIRNYWLLDAVATQAATQHIFSNGATSLHFYLSCPVTLDAEARTYRTSLNRHDLSSMDLHHPSGPLVLLGVEFVPFCSRLFFADHPDRQHASPVDLADADFIELERQVFEAYPADGNVSPDVIQTLTQLLDGFFCQRLSAISVDEVNMERLGSVFEGIVPLEGEPTAVRDYDNLSTADLASVACLSQKQFTRVFSEHVGLRPKAYLRLLRFHKALSELQRPNATLTEIAWKCGYCDMPHMTNDFRQLCGHTPSELLEMGSLLTEAFQPSFSGQMKKKVLLEHLV